MCCAFYFVHLFYLWIICTCAFFLCALLQLYANRYALPLLTRPQRQKRQNTEQKVNDVFQPVISSFFFCACETHSFDVLMRKEHETQSNNKCWMLKNELPKIFFLLNHCKTIFFMAEPIFSYNWKSYTFISSQMMPYSIWKLDKRLIEFLSDLFVWKWASGIACFRKMIEYLIKFNIFERENFEVEAKINRSFQISLLG